MSRRHRLLPMLPMLSLLTGLLTACGGEERADPFAMMEGEGIYKAECVSCHGAQLQGVAGDSANSGPALDGKSKTWEKADAELLQLIARGPSQLDSHAFAGKLSEKQMRNLLLYVQQQWPAEIRQQRQPGSTANSPSANKSG